MSLSNWQLSMVTSNYHGYQTNINKTQISPWKRDENVMCINIRQGFRNTFIACHFEGSLDECCQNVTLGDLSFSSNARNTHTHTCAHRLLWKSMFNSRERSILFAFQWPAFQQGLFQFLAIWYFKCHDQHPMLVGGYF